MRVVLFNLTREKNFNGYPLGLLYLISYARKYYSKYKEEDFLFNSIPVGSSFFVVKKKIPFDVHEKIIFCFSMGTPDRFYIRDLAKKLKHVFINSLVLVGGIHPTLDKETLTHCSAIDIAVRGEGEATFLELIENLSVRFSIADLKDVLGLSFRYGQDQIIHNLDRPRIKNLDDIPFPARDKFDVIGKQSRALGNGQCVVFTSRGCAYKCFFCLTPQFWGGQVTYRSIENVLEEIHILVTQFKGQDIYIGDDTFVLSRERVLLFCERLQESRLSIVWHCNIRANTVDRELLEAMYASGCRSVFMGIESGRQFILDKVVNKDINLSQAETVICWCKEIGLEIICSFSYSYPGETLEDVLETFAFIERNELPAPSIPHMVWLWIYPGTPLFDYAKKNKKLPKNFHWFKYYYEYNSFQNVHKVPHFVDKLSRKELSSIRAKLAPPSGALALQNWRELIKKVRTPSDIFYAMQLLWRKIAGKL